MMPAPSSDVTRITPHPTPQKARTHGRAGTGTPACRWTRRFHPPPAHTAGQQPGQQVPAQHRTALRRGAAGGVDVLSSDEIGFADQHRTRRPSLSAAFDIRQRQATAGPSQRAATNTRYTRAWKGVMTGVQWPPADPGWLAGRPSMRRRTPYPAGRKPACSQNGRDNGLAVSKSTETQW